MKKIQNKNSTGFEELLNYSKSNSGIYNQTVDADKDDWYAIEYGSSKGNSVINLKGLENDAYYYLYIKIDDENGKYISNEAVTLAQAKVHGNDWNLSFIGVSDFKWSEWGTTEKDTSIASGKLPKAGIKYVIYGGIFFVLALSGLIAYKKYRKYNF